MGAGRVDSLILYWAHSLTHGGGRYKLTKKIRSLIEVVDLMAASTQELIELVPDREAAVGRGGALPSYCPLTVRSHCARCGTVPLAEYTELNLTIRLRSTVQHGRFPISQHTQSTLSRH